MLSVACGDELSEASRDVATQTRREFAIESPPRNFEETEFAADNEPMETCGLVADATDDVVGGTGSAAVVDEPCASDVISSSVDTVPIASSRSVRSGKLNSFNDHVIYRHSTCGCFLVT